MVVYNRLQRIDFLAYLSYERKAVLFHSAVGNFTWRAAVSIFFYLNVKLTVTDIFSRWSFKRPSRCFVGTNKVIDAHGVSYVWPHSGFPGFHSFDHRFDHSFGHSFDCKSEMKGRVAVCFLV